MLKRFLTKLQTDWPIGVILLVVLGIVVTNYTPGTYLTGWDNLHPEFNFKLNIYRSLVAVWQEYQGLGLLGGMAHASDLPRQLFLWAVSYVLPQDTLRYFYHFLMLPIGMLGIYFLLDRVLLTSYPTKVRKVSSLVGSLFYLLNLGTIQYFYVPFEPYSTFWGFFPWELLTLLLFIKNPTQRNFTYFALANIAAIPQAYVQTIFLVYSICVTVVLAISLFEQRTKAFVRTVGIVLLTIFVINAFWLLPNLYFVATNLHVTQDAIQNQMATEKFFQMNKARGTVVDLPLLREFYFDFFDFNNTTGKFDYMMQTWRNQYNSPLVMLVGYFLFAIVTLGIIVNKKHRKVFFGLSLVCLVIFLSNTPGISLINTLFRALPLVNQILRNPFTKFIVPLVTLFGLGLGMGTAYLMEKLGQLAKPKLIAPIIILFFVAITTFPIFKGNFLSPSMRVAIPKEYFDLFSYFQSQDTSARIMNLPQGSFWGWYYYRFGLRGSGFLWYGIEQPILDRAFDVWSRENEDYYWQLSYALQKRDQTLFNAILEKYQVKFILFDQNILFADNINSVRYAFNQEALVKENPKLEKTAQFGKVIVYRVNLQTRPTANILGSTTPPIAETPKSTVSEDQSFLSLGLYQSPTDHSPQLTYPYQGLFTGRTTNERTFSVKQSATTSTITSSVPKGNYTLTTPSYFDTTSLLPVNLSAKLTGSVLTVDFALAEPSITIGTRTLAHDTKHEQITFTVPTASKDFYLDINNHDFFHLHNITTSFSAIGSTYLSNIDKLNYIRLYNGEAKITSSLGVNSFNPAKICGATGKAATVTSTVSDNTLTVSATNTANCTVYATPLSGFDNSLVHVSFNYLSSTDEFPQYCYYSQSASACLNKKDMVTTGFASDTTPFSDYFEGSINKADKGFLHLITEGQADEDKNQTKAITYSAITLTAYPYISGTSLSLASLKDASTSYALKLPSPDVIHVSIPTPYSFDSYMNPIAKNLYKKTPLNYDSALPGKYSLDEINVVPKELRAAASDASSYILLRANHLTAGNGYLLKLTTKHETGFPFTINVFTNEEFRSYAYTYASSAPSLQSDYFVLPPLYAFDHGLSVLLGSNSYNATPTSNDLIDMSIVPLPFTYLTSLSLSNNANSLPTATVLPIAVTKDSLTHYTVTASQQTRFITLSQGFNSGWHAYALNHHINAFSQLFPYLAGKELRHVKVNSWENGWQLVPSDTSKQIVIIYLPQLAEGIGFVCFGLGSIVALMIKMLPCKRKI